MDPDGLQEMREFADGDMGLDTAAAEVHEDGAVGEIIKLTADGALTKQILIAGKGNERPGSGDEVFVHYVGTLLDGTPFDSSRDRDEPFTFTLGEGRVIKGWDQGVATMRKGEKSILTCGPDYAYGASGSPPKIPGGATLQFEVELLNWKSIKDIAGDGGVIKTVTVEGDGFNKPQDCDEVTVVYSIKVQGSEQPVIVSEPQGEEFTVSAGLRGLLCFPTAVKTMKKGEKATLLVDASYGFGAAGAEGVPPNSSLEVELQLVSFKKIEDVTEDGKVTKKTIVDTEEWKRPNEGSQVTVRLTGTLADGTLFESHPQGEELVFTTDSEMVCDGLDLCVMKMKKGERCLVTVPPEYAYGAAGHTGKLATIPPEATLTFDVELVEVENAKETWDMSDTEKVEAAVAQKEKGNAAFKTGKLQRAVHLWDKAVLLIAYDKTFPDDVKAQVKEVKRSLWLNLSAAHLKLCHWKEAVENATKVLEHEPFHVKALYRSAQGLMGTQDFVEAEEAIKKGLTGEPANADLLALQRKLKVACKHVEAQEKALFSKMFASKPRSAAAAAAPIPVEAVVPPADA